MINDKRITIEVDDSDVPWVTLQFQDCLEVIRIKASGEADAVLAAGATEIHKEINDIADAIHQAYLEAIKLCVYKPMAFYVLPWARASFHINLGMQLRQYDL